MTDDYDEPPVDDEFDEDLSRAIDGYFAWADEHCSEALEGDLPPADDSGAFATSRAGRSPDDLYIDERYRIVRELGNGSQGVVYLAEDTRLGDRKVAVKRLRGFVKSARARARFQREADVMANIDHPSICPIYDFGDDRHVTYFTMRYVEGEDLAQRIRQARAKGRSLIFDDSSAADGENDDRRFHVAAQLIETVARALHDVHEQGVVHRDIKPGNIVVGKDETPVLIDFGIARVDDEPTLAGSSQPTGTVFYMPPEQAERGASDVDRTADIYSLGVTLYECVALRRPFTQSTTEALLLAVLREEPPSILDLVEDAPRDLSIIVETAMAKDKTKRYQSAEALADDLERFRRGEPIHAKPRTKWDRLKGWTKRNPDLAKSVGAAVGLAAASVLAIGLLTLTIRDQRRRGEADRELAKAEEVAQKKNLSDLVAALALDPLERRIDGVMARRSSVGEIEAARDAVNEIKTRLGPAGDHESAGSSPKRSESDFGFVRPSIKLELEATRSDLDEIERRLQPGRKGEDVAKLRSMKGQLQAEIDNLVKMQKDDQGEDTRLSLLLGTMGSGETPVLVIDDARSRLEAMLERLDNKLRRINEAPSALDWAERWAVCRDRIARNDEYERIDLPVQEDLVPLGPDPASRLEEFLHVPSHGKHAPELERGADKRLCFAQDTGLVFVLLPQMTTGARPFFISKYEMSQGQWLRLTDDNPSRFKFPERTVAEPLRHPVEQISWVSACDTLVGWGLRLPKQDEWEFAARGNMNKDWLFWTGSDAYSLEGKANLCDFTAAEVMNTAWGRPVPFYDDHLYHAPVDSMLPNPFGLHHILGNVIEWTSRWVPRPIEWEALGLASRWAPYKGGGFKDQPDALDIDARNFHPNRDLRSEDVGVRPVRDID